MKKHLPVLLILLFLVSCREEVVAPDNPAGNVNEPVFSRTSFSYTFSINAEKITRLVRDNTYLNAVKSGVFLQIDDYSSGSVEIEILTGGSIKIYSSVFNSNTNGTIEEFQGYQPEIITINFVDFTGKLKIILSEKD